MDKTRFGVMTRRLSRFPLPLPSPHQGEGSSPSRRDVMRGLVGAGLGLSALRLLDGAEAKKKHKKKDKKKKLLRNAFGCVDVGQKCAGNSANCCSGICQGTKPKKGKKDTSLCVAHNTGVCIASTDTCSVGVAVSCNASDPNCGCFRTTGNAGFCGSFTGNGTGGIRNCRVCSKDTDCQAEFGAGAACVVLGGICTNVCLATGTTACAVSCA